MLDLNTLYNMDCMIGMTQFPDNYFDICITSPPYNIGGNRISAGFTKKKYNSIDDNLPIEDYFNQTTEWINELLRIVKYHIFWNIQESTKNWGIVDHIRNEYKDNLKEVFIWAKSNAPICIVDTMCGHGFEYIFCISKDNPKSRKFNYCDFSNRSGDYVNNVIIKPVNSNNNHSYGFGEWLPDFFITHFSKEDSKIIDPFIGSGTTAVISEKRKRQWIGFELDKDYYEAASKRIETYKQQLKLF